MINKVYQLLSPKFISVKHDNIRLAGENQVLIRPVYVAACHADQRYYQGKRDPKILKAKLPMALIHEAVGEVVYDPKGEFYRGEYVTMIPNQPLEENDGFYENYQKGYFRSSGHDGFMREFVRLPHDRVVSVGKAELKVATITEFISVAVHATRRFRETAHTVRKRIAVWGDGSLAYVLAGVLRRVCPESEIIVIGRNQEKLNLFTFVHQTFRDSELDADFRIDHAFECCGGDGSFYAIDDIIRVIRPQGNIMLMGVTENRVPINTRDILEKGLTLIGCSRSGREDFVEAVECLQDPTFSNRLKRILFESAPIRTVDDIHRFFADDLATTFKTIAKWEI